MTGNPADTDMDIRLAKRKRIISSLSNCRQKRRCPYPQNAEGCRMLEEMKLSDVRYDQPVRNSSSLSPYSVVWLDE